MPAMNTDRVSWTCPASAAKSSASAGRAGRYMSTASGVKALSAPSVTMISGTERVIKSDLLGKSANLPGAGPLLADPPPADESGRGGAGAIGTRQQIGRAHV